MMPTHVSMMETSRHTKKTLYVVAVFYVVVGFVAATASALNGDRLGTFLGFLIVSGALGTTALLRAVLRIGMRLSAMGGAVAEMHARLGRMETGLNELRERAGLDDRSPPKAGSVRMLDLAALGNDNPNVLTAATIDQDAYPRLVASLEEEPPPRGEERIAPSWTVQSESAGVGTKENQTESTSENLMRQWRVSLGDGDLTGCRALYAALVDAAGEDTVGSLGKQMEELADRVERSLREAFSLRVREGDYAGGLAIGERICSLLPDRPVAAEFHRIRPYLLARLHCGGATSGVPLAASQ